MQNMKQPINTTNSNNRIEKIAVRVNNEEKFLIQQLAKKNNLSVSDYLRNIIFTQILNLEMSLSNKIQDMFDNTFKSYYLVYKLAQNAFGYEKAKGFIDTAKNRLYSMKSDENNSDIKRNNVNNSSNIDNYVYGNNDYNNNNYNSN